MYDFIVGGYLPGTNVQISFQVWVGITTIIFGCALIAWIEYKNVKFLYENVKVPLMASQLHYRVQYSE